MAHLSIGGQENPAPEEWTEHVLCDRYKWTLEYVRRLPLPDLLNLFVMQAAEAKVQQQAQS